MQKRKNSFHFLNPFKFLFLFVCLWKKIGHLMLGKFFLLVLRDCFKNIQRDLLLSFHVFISLFILRQMNMEKKFLSALFLEYIPASFAEQILHLKETSSHVSGFAVTRCLEEILADGTRHFRAIPFFAYDSSHATKVPFYVKQSPFHKKIQYVDPIYSSAWFHSYY